VTDFSHLSVAVHIWDDQQQFWNIRVVETLISSLKTLCLGVLILGAMRA
jgi:hypothetical protein